MGVVNLLRKRVVSLVRKSLVNLNRKLVVNFTGFSIQVGLNSYFLEKDRLKAIKYLSEVENIFKGHPILAHVFVPLARLWYEQGDLSLSKEYTRKLETTKKFSFLVILNNGFYAIIENDQELFIRNYKKFLNRQDLETNVVLVIDFLNTENEKYPNSRHLFELAEATLTKLFINSSEGDRLLRIFLNKYKDNHDYKELKSFAFKVFKRRVLVSRSQVA